MNSNVKKKHSYRLIIRVIPCFLLLLSGSSAIAATGVSWPMFLPAIMHSSTETPKYSQWGIQSHVCCNMSPYSFSANLNGVNLISTANTCAADGNVPGYQEVESGTYTISWSLRGAPCPTFNGTLSQVLEENKQYLFKMKWVDGAPEIEVVETALNIQ